MVGIFIIGISWKGPYKNNQLQHSNIICFMYYNRMYYSRSYNRIQDGVCAHYWNPRPLAADHSNIVI